MEIDLNQEIANIDALIAQNQYKEAYQLCNKLLLNFPDNFALAKIQHRIEKIVYKKNVESIKKDLNDLKPLWEKGDYETLIRKLKTIQSYVPGYAKVENQLLKARKLYNKEMVEKQKDTIYSYIQKIEANIKEKKYLDAIVLCKQVLKSIKDHGRAKELMQKARSLYVHDMINKNKKLLASEKYKEIEIFLKDLLKVNPNSNQVKALYQKAASKEKISIEYEKKDFTYQSYENIVLLYQKKKYEKAVYALKELIHVDPNNLKALELYKKAKRKFHKQLSGEVTKKIKKLQKKFKNEYQKDSKEFIRI